MFAYPFELPLPDYGSYTGVVDQGLIRTSFPIAAPSQIKGFNSPTVQISLTFSMTNAQWYDWNQFITNYGYQWFTMPVVSPKNPNLITSVHRVRTISDIQYVKRGHNWVSTTIIVEMVPGDADDPLAVGERVYDTIVAGSPQTPSADVIVAGLPPSPEFISASIYYYTETL